MGELWKGVYPVSGTALFDTIPKEDPLSLFRGRDPDYQKVVRLLDFRKKDVARASQMSIQSIRYDYKMPKELEERVREWAVALSLVAQYFKNEHKTTLWFKTPNPLLGNITPRDMIRVGRFKKLSRFIQNALSENEPAATEHSTLVASGSPIPIPPFPPARPSRVSA